MDGDNEVLSTSTTEIFASAFTVLDAETRHQFGTSEYYSQLVQKNMETSKRWIEDAKLKDVGNLRSLSHKVLCMGTMSLDYMLWSVQSEYDNMEKKGATSDEQLYRTRQMFLEISMADPRC